MMNRPRVLIVDDSLATCFFVATALENAGYAVDFASSGQEGLAKVVMFQPHCLLLDVMLPDMSGYAVCRHVQQSMPQNSVYIILVSAKKTPLDQSYGLHQGAHHYLPKPFTAEALVQNVWEGVPWSIRHTVLPTLSTIPLQIEPAAPLNLMPRRVVTQGAMRTNNPFACTPVIKDKQARQLYEAIDGRRTLAEIAVATGLEDKEVAKALAVLLKENCVRVYDSAGQAVESAL